MSREGNDDWYAEVAIPEAAQQAMRWESSPLNHRIMDVIRYRQEHRDKDQKIGDNKATKLVMFAAEELLLLYEDIMAGKRDEQGYPKTG